MWIIISRNVRGSRAVTQEKLTIGSSARTHPHSQSPLATASHSLSWRKSSTHLLHKSTRFKRRQEAKVDLGTLVDLPSEGIRNSCQSQRLLN